MYFRVENFPFSALSFLLDIELMFQPQYFKIFIMWDLIVGNSWWYLCAFSSASLLYDKLISLDLLCGNFELILILGDSLLMGLFGCVEFLLCLFEGIIDLIFLLVQSMNDGLELLWGGIVQIRFLGLYYHSKGIYLIFLHYQELAIFLVLILVIVITFLWENLI